MGTIEDIIVELYHATTPHRHNHSSSNIHDESPLLVQNTLSHRWFSKLPKIGFAWLLAGWAATSPVRWEKREAVSLEGRHCYNSEEILHQAETTNSCGVRKTSNHRSYTPRRRHDSSAREDGDPLSLVQYCKQFFEPIAVHYHLIFLLI